MTLPDCETGKELSAALDSWEIEQQEGPIVQDFRLVYNLNTYKRSMQPPKPSINP